MDRGAPVHAPPPQKKKRITHPTSSFPRSAQLDRNFPAYYRLRAERLASPRGPKLFYTLPDRPNLVRGGADAARELVQELAKFLVARYPGVYRATRRGDVIVAVEVLPVGVTHDLEAEDPMVVAAML